MYDIHTLYQMSSRSTLEVIHTDQVFLHLDLWLRHESAGQKSEQKKGGTLTY